MRSWVSVGIAPTGRDTGPSAKVSACTHDLTQRPLGADLRATDKHGTPVRELAAKKHMRTCLDVLDRRGVVAAEAMEEEGGGKQQNGRSSKAAGSSMPGWV